MMCILLTLSSLQVHSSSLTSDIPSTEVMELSSDIDSKDQELAQHDQSLKQAELKRKTISEEFTAVKQKLTESQSRITKLAEEKNDLENTLKLREFEFQIMQQSATQQMEMQRQSISLKEKDIADLKERLKTVRKELDETKFYVPALRVELQKASQELASKSTEINLLREAKEEMKLSLDIERKRYDNYVMQQTAANTSTDSYKQEVEVLYRQEWHDNILVVHVQFTIYVHGAYSHVCIMDCHVQY